MKTLMPILLVLLMAACGTAPPRDATRNAIDAELKQALADRKPDIKDDAVSRALLPPLDAGMAKPDKKAERRFDLAVTNAPASQVFLAIGSDSRYSVLVHPEVSGSVSVNLKNVTVIEALDTLRELYGYEYKIQGTRIFIQPVSMQTRIYQVNYLTAQRLGRSQTRVSSGSIVGTTGAQQAGTGTSGTAPTTPAPVPGAPGSAATADGSVVSTSNRTDFWEEIEQALKLIIGGEAGGRRVVVTPQAGIVVVRALPRELREVADFLSAQRLTVERQVMLEAKIVEVRLNDGYQSGINWAAFDSAGNHRFSAGADPTRFNIGSSTVPGVATGSVVTATDSTTSAVTTSTLGQVLSRPFAGVLGLAFQTRSFSALLSFLETQGAVQVLSSPRIATLNNQKAVLKVGTDEFFVTNVTTTTSSTASGSTTSPSITVQPFFSGIALDVTPQIDEAANIILHIRPSVSTITEKTKNIDLGTLGTFTLPLASSAINESDSIVRVRDGNIVAIGGLMQQTQSDDNSKVPGAGDVPLVGQLFKHGSKSLAKRELVILLKPTVIHSDKQWQDDLAQTRERLNSLEPAAPTQPAGQ